MRTAQPNSQVMLNLGTAARGEASSPAPKRLMARTAITLIESPAAVVRAIRRTAVYGPVRTVVWEGRGREAPPYPDRWRKTEVSFTTRDVR